MLKIVLDTNVLISAIGYNSPNRIIFDKIISEDLILCVTNDIMLEYSEVISRKITSSIARNIYNFLRNATNVYVFDVYFNWELIINDKSDNKFTDCFICSNADYLITNDKHFNILRSIEFPKINLINAEDFKIILQSL